MFTEGILAMETTLVGVIKVEPRQLPEEGIRKELVLQIATALDRSIQFKNPNKPLEEFQAILIQLSKELDGIKASVLSISIHPSIYPSPMYSGISSYLSNGLLYLISCRDRFNTYPIIVTSMV